MWLVHVLWAYIRQPFCRDPMTPVDCPLQEPRTPLLAVPLQVSHDSCLLFFCRGLVSPAGVCVCVCVCVWLCMFLRVFVIIYVWVILFECDLYFCSTIQKQVKTKHQRNVLQTRTCTTRCDFQNGSKTKPSQCIMISLSLSEPF